ncbi:MAG: NAD(P)H-binding protein [Yaniella sp.]|nr:NAD(P)H-binding protein [Yaniella sp.]
MTQQVLVTGGTGRLGRVLVPKLLDVGYNVRVLSRMQQGPAGHRWVIGDLMTGGVSDAVEDIDIIIHLATTQSRQDIKATENLIAAARTAGNPHLIYLSIVGIDDAMLSYYQTKLACEQRIETSDLPWTILRATQFHDLIYEICHAQRRLPVLFMPSKVAFQPIDVSEVADRLCALVSEPAAGRVPDMGGPLVPEGKELAKPSLRATGSRRSIWPLALPRKIIGDFRQGSNLAPDRAVGQVTFEQFLRRRQDQEDNA